MMMQAQKSPSAMQAGGLDPALQGFMGTQGYSGWVGGQPVGPALPRPWDTFYSGQFGPLGPILPMPIDVPAPGNEGDRPAPRRWSYNVGFNLPIGQPGSEGYTLAAFGVLRGIADRFSTVRALVNIRVKELAGMEWDIGPTKDAQQAAKTDKGMMKDQAARAKQLVQWFKWGIDSNYHGFQRWFKAALEDQFVIDAVAMHPLPTLVPGKGLFGRGIAEMELLDASTIKALVALDGSLPAPPAVAFQQYIYGVPRVDMLQVLAMDAPADEQKAILEAAGVPQSLDDLEPDGQYRADQLLYLRDLQRTWTTYGFGPVAQSLLPIAIGMQRQVWFNDFYAEGTVPSVFVVAGPQYNTTTQQRQLQDFLNALAGDIAWKHRIIVLPPGSETKPQKDMTIAKEVDQAIVDYLLPVFQIKPQEIGLIPGGKSQGLGGSGATQMMQESTNSARVKPDAKMWKDTVFDYIIQHMFGQDDLEWKWTDLQNEQDEDKQAVREASLIATGQKAIDQIRVDHGDDPWNLPLTMKPFYQVGAGIIPLDPETQVPAGIAPQGAPTAAPGAEPEMGPDGKPVPPKLGPDGKPLPPEPKLGPDGKPMPKPDPFAKPDKPQPSVPPIHVHIHTEGAEGDDAQAAPDAASADEEPKAAPKLTVADLVKGKVRYTGNITTTVLDYLRRSYPEKVIGWVKDGKWEYDPKVKLSKINMARRPGGRDPEKVEAIGETLSRGASLDPVVLVERVDQSQYKYDVADGFHRLLGADHAGIKAVPAFIGKGYDEAGLNAPWGTAMQDDSDSKKAVLAELAVFRRYLKGGRDAAKFTSAVLSRVELDRIAGGVKSAGLDGTFVDWVGKLGLVTTDTAGMSFETAFRQASLALKAKDPSVGGGVDRSKIPLRDFVFPEDAPDGGFPVTNAGDVDDAVHSWGRYKGPRSFEDFKRRLTSIARRKGFLSALPASWDVKKIVGDYPTADEVEERDAVDQRLGLHPESEKDISVGSPLASGFAPFDLEGQTNRCGACGAALVEGECPNGHGLQDMGSAKVASVEKMRDAIRSFVADELNQIGR